MKKKMLSIVLILTITILNLTNGAITVQAEEENGEVTQEAYATAYALPFTMLETYLYAITGQQAYDTYYGNEEKQQALHEDFCSFLETQEQGADIAFRISMANGKIITLKMEEMLDYYKTAGSSALAEAHEEVSRNLKVIMGSGNSENNEDYNNDDEPEVISVGGSPLLNSIIGKYITSLTNGERGEVSEDFLNGGQEVPQYCFDGNYTVIDGVLYYDYWGNALLTHQNSAKMSVIENYTQIGAKDLLYWYGNEVTRQSIYINPEQKYNWTGGTWVVPYFWGIANEKKAYISSGNMDITYNGIDINNTTYNGLYFSYYSYMNITGIPVFVSMEALEWYLDTGDPSGAINYFEQADIKEGYYSFDFSEISEKLENILKVFTTLPLVTTESLAGFAQGVNEQVSGQLNPNSTPEEQQEAVKGAMEDNAKKVATEQLADESKKTADELATELEATPKPTATPEEQVTKKEAQIIVDLHDFFPFCVPYDLVHLIKALNAEPEAPRFEGEILVVNKEIPVVLDLSNFEELAGIFRAFETALFILGLILVTRKLIGG